MNHNIAGTQLTVFCCIDETGGNYLRMNIEISYRYACLNVS